MDPNWFYSTVSQTAGAIIGLIGAILISMLLQQLNANKESRKELLDLFKRYLNGLRGRLQHLANWQDDQQTRLKNMKTESEKGRTSIMLDLEYSFFDKDQCQKPIPLSEDSFDEQNQALEAVKSRRNYMLELLKFRNFEKFIDRIKSAPQKEEKAVNEINEYLGPHINEGVEKFQQFKKNIIPKSIFLLLSALIWLCIVGVFVPLLFIYPGEDTWPKILLLLGFGIGVGLIILYLILLLKKIYKENKIELEK